MPRLNLRHCRPKKTLRKGMKINLGLRTTIMITGTRVMTIITRAITMTPRGTNMTTRKKAKNLKIGYNVLTDEYVDMVKEGVIDPAKVTRGALENAASIAAMILTTEALITDVPEKDKPAAPPMPEY